MTKRIDPNLHREIARFGGADVDKCFNCGNCTAICNLSDEKNAFPRKVMHYLQVGNREKLRQSADPWLCYYCGDCTADCPRDANPGETMMATRRWLTAQYDWTGLAGKMYTSLAWEIAAIGVVAAFIVALFAMFHGPVITDHVALNTFAPEWVIEIGDLIMAAILSFFLLTNAFRLYLWIMRSDKKLKVPLAAYVKAVPEFIVQFTTQKRWRVFGDKRRWLRHFLLVSGYLTMLVLILGLLHWFQTDAIRPIWSPFRLFGYYATIVLVWATVDIMIDRYRKSDEMHKFSEPSDWIFPIMLFLTAVTGILVHILRLSGLPLSTYYIYVIHLAIAVPMLVVEVPFSKWSHLLYRPLVLYLVKVKEVAEKMPQKSAEVVAAA